MNRLSNRVQIQQATHVINNGGTVGYPTETLYGIGCSVYNEQAVRAISRIKHRSKQNNFIVIASHPDQIDHLCGNSAWQLEITQTTNTRPTTWIISAGPATPYWLTSKQDTLAIRITTHPVARLLCLKTGHALISTSANPHGKNPAPSALKARYYFGSQIDYYLPGGTTRNAQASRIIDARTQTILRD